MRFEHRKGRLTTSAVALVAVLMGCGGPSGPSTVPGADPEPCLAAVRRLTTTPTESARPSLTATSDGFALAWSEADGVHVRRLDRSGQFVGGDLMATPGGNGAGVPALVWTGSGFGLAWSDARDGNPEVYFRRLDVQGAPLGEALRVTNAPGVSLTPKVAWTGTRFGITWQDNRLGNFDVFFVEIDAAGAKQGADLPLTTATSDSFRPAIAWSGAEYGIGWNDDRNGNSEIYFTRAPAVTPERRVTADPALSLFAAVAWNGAAWGVSWGDDHGLAFARLGQDGSRIGQDLRLNSTGSGPVLAAGVGTYLLVWEDARSGDGDIFYAVLDASGARTLDDTPISPAPGLSTFPTVAATSDGLGVAWVDSRDGNPEIYFARVCRR